MTFTGKDLTVRIMAVFLFGAGLQCCCGSASATVADVLSPGTSATDHLINVRKFGAWTLLMNSGVTPDHCILANDVFLFRVAKAGRIALNGPLDAAELDLYDHGLRNPDESIYQVTRIAGASGSFVVRPRTVGKTTGRFVQSDTVISIDDPIQIVEVRPTTGGRWGDGSALVPFIEDETTITITSMNGSRRHKRSIPVGGLQGAIAHCRTMLGGS